MNFDTICAQWNNFRTQLLPHEEQSMTTLLSTKDPYQIISTLDLLIGIDESALCILLQQEKDFIIINANHRLHHPLIWSQHILETVKEEDSIWHSLYLSNAFSRMQFHLYHNKEWSTCDAIEQDSILCESKRMRLLPKGSFQMGGHPKAKYLRKSEKPRQNRRVSKSFFMGCYPVSQGLWESIMPRLHQQALGASKPTVATSWS